MIGIGTFLKLQKKGIAGVGQDEITEVLEALGITLTCNEVPISPESFRALGETASLPHAQLIDLHGTLKGGGKFHCLLAVTVDSDSRHSVLSPHGTIAQLAT